MKILEEKYPLGSIPNQITAGRYIDETLYTNLKILAKNITKDLTYLAVCSSSTYEVGAGKSTFMSQIGEAYTDLVNQIHGTNLTFDMNNIVFRPKDLITRSFSLPKYSCIILDEWEDTHYWSEIGITLRQFFRKCRQLNLFMILIIPNFFQLGINYAVSRSLFFIDVRFEGEFDRGYFKLYNYDSKKYLYLFGKKNQDYNATKSDINGRFVDGYAVNEAEYKAVKLRDAIESEDRVHEEKEKKELILKTLMCTILKKEFNLSSRKQEELFDRYNFHIGRDTICGLIKESQENLSLTEGAIL